MELDSISAMVEKYRKSGKPLDEIKEIMYTNGIAVGIIVDWINGIETQAGVLNANFQQEIRDSKKEQVIVTLPD